MRVASLGLMAVLLVPACAPTAPQPGTGTEPGTADLSSCHATGLDGMIGSPVSMLPQGSWSTLRVLKPGMMATMDYAATRLNVRVDGRGTILELTCG